LQGGFSGQSPSYKLDNLALILVFLIIIKKKQHQRATENGAESIMEPTEMSDKDGSVVVATIKAVRVIWR